MIFLERKFCIPFPGFSTFWWFKAKNPHRDRPNAVNFYRLFLYLANFGVCGSGVDPEIRLVSDAVEGVIERHDGDPERA